MTRIVEHDIRADSLLGRYAGSGAYVDSYAFTCADGISLARFVEAFYTSPLFKVERRLIALALGLPADDADARMLATGGRDAYSAWHVEARTADQLLVAVGRTRSWFMVAPGEANGEPATTLFFGSAVVPRKRGGLGWQFNALLGFHKLYSRALLSAAARRLAARR